MIPDAFRLTLPIEMRKALFILFFGLLSFGSKNLSAQDPIAPKFVVYIFLSDECPICQYYTPTLNKLYQDYKSDSIQFIGIFPNFASKPSKIEGFVQKYNIEFPTKHDYYKSLTSKFNASVTPEVIVFNQIDKSVLYQGRIDNSYVNLGKRRRVVTKHELKDVLDAIVLGKVKIQEPVKSIGCFINMSDQL